MSAPWDKIIKELQDIVSSLTTLNSKSNTVLDKAENILNKADSVVDSLKNVEKYLNILLPLLIFVTIATFGVFIIGKVKKGEI